MKSFYDSVMELLHKLVEERFDGNVANAARGLNVSISTLHAWLSGFRSPNLKQISGVLDLAGISFPSSGGVPSTQPGVQYSPEGQSYAAVPLLGEADAGPGIVPTEGVRGWVMIDKQLPPFRLRRNLIAVRIGENSRSMIPTLFPGNVVIVDRDDRTLSRRPRLMLVLDPDGCGMIKRVSIEDLPNGSATITFASDNVPAHPPIVYDLRLDYAGDWDRVVVGRAVFTWADLRER